MDAAGWFAWGCVVGSGSTLVAQITVVAIFAPKAWRGGIWLVKRLMGLEPWP